MENTKHPLQALIEDAGYECRSYSGRAMYGKQCLGVDLDRGQRLGELMACIIECIGTMVNDHADDESVDKVMAELDVVATGFRSMRSDNMGMGMIYYFEDVPFIAEDEGEEDEEG